MKVVANVEFGHMVGNVKVDPDLFYMMLSVVYGACERIAEKLDDNCRRLVIECNKKKYILEKKNDDGFIVYEVN